MKVLVTGGAGFIGSNFVLRTLAEKERDIEIANVDSLTYAGNLENLKGLEGDERHRFFKTDIRDEAGLGRIFAEFKPEMVINFAAESHVDRSIESPQVFVETNVTGTLNLLRLSLEKDIKRFVQVSTDEVYGSLGPDDPAFTEKTPLAPNSPYAASKASADMMVRAFHHTFGLDCVITRCSNNYGPYQFPEKLIPLMVSNALEGKNLPVYGDGMNVRDWIHVHDHVDGVWLAAERGVSGQVYNLGGKTELPNLELVKSILDYLEKPHSLIQFVKDRPGHDRRYAMDISKSEKEIGFSPAVAFSDGIRSTIDWYCGNRSWWEKIKSGEYRDYYERMYAGR